MTKTKWHFSKKTTTKTKSAVKITTDRYRGFQTAPYKGL